MRLVFLAILSMLNTMPVYTQPDTIRIAQQQVFRGISTNKMNTYHCALKINTDSSVIFIYNTDANVIYGQYIGIIKRINDSAFQVLATMMLGKFDEMRLYTRSLTTNKVNDTDYFSIDTPFIKFSDTISIRYSDEQIRYFLPYDKQKKKSVFPLDKNLFNQKTGNNYFTVSINRKMKLRDYLLLLELNMDQRAHLNPGIN